MSIIEFQNFESGQERPRFIAFGPLRDTMDGGKAVMEIVNRLHLRVDGEADSMIPALVFHLNSDIQALTIQAGDESCPVAFTTEDGRVTVSAQTLGEMGVSANAPFILEVRSCTALGQVKQGLRRLGDFVVAHAYEGGSDAYAVRLNGTNDFHAVHTTIDVSQMGEGAVAAGHPLEAGRFHSESPLPLNLLNAASGPFKEIAIPGAPFPIRILVDKESSLEGFRFAQGALLKAAQGLTEKYDSLPPQYGVVVLPSAYNEAMEIPGNTFTTSSRVEVSTGASDREVYRRNTLVVHELFHRGPGNLSLVEGAGAASFHEGLTTQAEWDHSRAVWGEALPLVVQNFYASAMVAAGKLSHPIVQETHMNQGSKVWGSLDTRVTYGLSSMVFNLLRDVLGNEAYEKNLRTLYRDYQGNRSWAEWLRVICKGLDAEDIEKLKDWFLQDTLPHVRLEEIRGGTVTLSQSGTSSPRLIPLHLIYLSEDGSTIAREKVLMREARQLVSLPEGVHHVVMEHSGIPVRFTIPSDISRDRLVVANESLRLSTRQNAVAGLWKCAFEAALRGDTPSNELLQVFEQLIQLGSRTDAQADLVGTMMEMPEIGSLLSEGSTQSLSALKTTQKTLWVHLAQFIGEEKLQNALAAYQPDQARLTLDEHYDPRKALVGYRNLAKVLYNLLAQSPRGCEILMERLRSTVLQSDFDGILESLVSFGEKDVAQAAITFAKVKMNEVSNVDQKWILIGKILKAIACSGFSVEEVAFEIDALNSDLSHSVRTDMYAYLSTGLQRNPGFYLKDSPLRELVLNRIEGHLTCGFETDEGMRGLMAQFPAIFDAAALTTSMDRGIAIRALTRVKEALLNAQCSIRNKGEYAEKLMKQIHGLALIDELSK